MPSWLADAQRPPEKLPADVPKLTSLLVDAAGKAITTKAGWKSRRAELRSAWFEFLHPPVPYRGGAPKLEVLEEVRVDSVVRQLVRYETERGITTEAYLMRPADAASKKLPAVAVFHSTVDFSIAQPAGLKGEPTLFFALELARRGYVTLAPRNFLWPTNDRLAAKEETERFLKRHAASKGMAKMLLDALVAVDILVARPDVDPERIGSIGHSLGAKEVLYLAAFDERVKCTVSSEGGIGLGFSNWHDAWYLGAAIKEPEFAREHHELLALAAPRPFLLIGGDSADGAKSWPFIDAALPVYKLYDDRPRLGLLNHRQGHLLPVETARQVYEWFAAYC